MSTRLLLSFLPVLLCVCCWTPTAAMAQINATNASTGLIESQPVNVYVAAEFLEVAKIDGVAQTFFVDLYLTCVYQDDNVDSVPDPNGPARQEPSAATIASFRQKLDLDFPNKVDVSESFSSFLIHKNRPPFLSSSVQEQRPGRPWIELSTRYSGTFKAELHLEDFPYDKQSISVEIETISFDNTRMIFQKDLDNEVQTNAFAKNIYFLQWRKLRDHTFISSTDYVAFKQTYSRFSFSLDLDRIGTYYIRKIVVGMAILTLMANMSFVCHSTDGGALFNVLCLFVGLVCYLFVITGDLPKVAYSTRLDTFVSTCLYFCCFDFIFLGVIYAIEKASSRHKEEVVDELKRKLLRGGGGFALSKSNDNDDEEGVENPPGWWDEWKANRRKIGTVLCALFNVAYLIAIIVIFEA